MRQKPNWSRQASRTPNNPPLAIAVCAEAPVIETCSVIDSRHRYTGRPLTVRVRIGAAAKGVSLRPD